MDFTLFCVHSTIFTPLVRKMADFNQDFYQSGYSYEGSTQGPQSWNAYPAGAQYPAGDVGYGEGYPGANLGQMSGGVPSSYGEQSTGFEDEPPLLEGAGREFL